MEKTISLYRESQESVIVFHNKNILPPVNVPHLHSQYEFYYNIDGARGLFADKTFYECTGRDLFLIPQLCVHKVLVSKNVDYERCIINIDSKFIDAVNASPDMHGPLSWIVGADNPRPQKVTLTPEEHKQFLKLISLHNQSTDELIRHARLLEILAYLKSLFAKGKHREEAPGTPHSIPEQALLLAEENFSHIKIADISGKLYINSSHLSVLFKEEYGITLEQYLIIRKIAEAKKYLYMGMPVNEVCQLCGFHNDSNFSRTFKKYEGYSPKQLERLSNPL